MQTKVVNRYYCDHCKKSGGRKHRLARHESGCTNNPNRVCRMCKLAELEQKPIAELIAVYLDESSDFDYISSDGPMQAEKLEAAAGHCPACILAAIRQSGSVAYCSFDFKYARDEFFKSLARNNGPDA